ncbi:TonB family protein [Melaminivora sp.]
MARPSNLHIALGISLALHAALLSVRFIDPEGFNRVFQDTPLEVILVNARSQERPDKAQAIAQAALAGGGDAEAGRATSPLPSSAATRIGDELEESQRQMDHMLQQQTQILAQMQQDFARLPAPDPRAPSETGEQPTQEQKRLHLQKLLAEIEKRVQEENARPRKRYISPATREEAYAIYYDALRRKVEDKGTHNFPEYAGKRLYGELVMILTVNHDGRVLESEIAISSGNPQLDRRAEAIARAAGPFGAFTPAMRARADQLAVVSRFKFTHQQTLETEVR